MSQTGPEKHFIHFYVHEHGMLEAIKHIALGNTSDPSLC